MTHAPLTLAQRAKILAAVQEAVGAASPRSPTARQASEAGGVGDIDRHLDGLVEIVRRTSATTIEPYMAQLYDEVCTNCPYQFHSGYCPLREVRGCATDSHLGTIVAAIAGCLKKMQDPDYLMHRLGLSRVVRDRRGPQDIPGQPGDPGLL